MKQNRWLANVRSRLGLALLSVVAVMTLYAEGIFDNPWISLFTMPSGFDEGLLARTRFVALFMAPVFGYVVAPRIPWLRDLLIIFMVCCLMVSGVDLLLRLPKPTSANQLSAWWFPRLPWIWRFQPNLDVEVYSYGDLAGRSPEAKHLGEPHTIIWKTDAAGFRNGHDGKGIDLLVLGDSFGAGYDTTQDRIFTMLLERQYGRNVYNLSLPGSPYHEYVNFLVESQNMTFQPNAQVVWVFFTGNDLHDGYGDIWEPNSFPWQEGMKAWVTTYKNFRARSPLRRMIIGAYRSLFGGSPGQIVIQRELPNGQPFLFHKEYDEHVNLSKAEAEHHPHFSKLERTMVEMRKRAAERGLDVTVVLIPAKEEVYRWILNRRDRRPEDTNPSGFALAVLDTCQRLQIRCLDMKPYLTEEAYRLFDSSGEVLYWRDDTHINDHGHQATAEFIAREILAVNSHPLPLSRISE